MTIDATPSEGCAPIWYRCHSDVVWAIESVGLVLIRRDTRKRLVLHYPEAALWDLLSRQVAFDRLIKMMAAIAGLELSAAREWVTKTINGWARESWLIGGEGHG